MFWKKRQPAQSKKSVGKRNPPLPPKPTPRGRSKRAKRIDFKLSCYLIVIKNQNFFETATVNMSHSGLLIRSLEKLEVGQEVLCYLSHKANLSYQQVQSEKKLMRGRIVRVEPQEMMCRMAIEILWGRVNPIASQPLENERNYWWSRYWQSSGKTASRQTSLRKRLKS